MSIKQPIYHEFDLNATSGNSRVISLTHTDDAHVDVIELCVKQQGVPVDITGATVIARMVLHGTTDVLLNDSVPCTINDAGNILIPFDNAAVQTRKGIVKIEVNITRDPDILTLQLPLWVKINGSILDDATVDPHSEGTIPELLKDAADALEEATQALEDAKDYANLENKPQINSHTLSGNQSSDDLGLQGKLTAGTNITIENDGTISASGGVTSYEDLTDKPKVWGDTGQYDLDKILYFPDFDLSLKGWVRQLSIKPLNYGKLENGTSYYMHENFKNSVNLNVPTLDLYGKWFCFDANNAVGLPSGIDVVISRYENQTKKVVWGSYRTCQVSSAFIEIELPLIEEIYWTDSNLKNHHAVRTCFKDTTNIKKFTDWTELSGGSQLVSGVVNQNGTITFTDSGGNTFTTSGAKLVTSDSEQINMGYDSDGFYFLFDDGQEAS